MPIFEKVFNSPLLIALIKCRVATSAFRLSGSSLGMVAVPAPVAPSAFLTARPATGPAFVILKRAKELVWIAIGYLTLLQIGSR